MSDVSLHTLEVRPFPARRCAIFAPEHLTPSEVWIRLGSVGVTDTARLFTGSRKRDSSAAVTSELGHHRAARVRDAGPLISYTFAMLELRPTCEHCNKALLPNPSRRASARSECTFCAACADVLLRNVCPNCGGGFCPRPIRPAKNWVAANERTT